MYWSYWAKAWLLISVGYQAGRLHHLEDLHKPGVRGILNPILHCDDGEVMCYACPETGIRRFRKRHKIAKYIRQHRHCGKQKLFYVDPSTYQKPAAKRMQLEKPWN